MKIVLVSSGQPSANPRLVKEAIAYAEAGHAVTVVYCPLSPWADAYDKELFQQYPAVKWISAGYHATEQKAGYLFARVRQKIYAASFKVGLRHAFFAVRSMALFTQELNAVAATVKGDVYIGHNLSALPVAVAAARKHGAKAVFDFEDFHRGEDKEGSLHWGKTTIVENQYVPRLRYATTASPLITATYTQLYPAVQFTTINNCFPIRYLQSKLVPADNTVLKLFWFSQFIGKKRGLETVVEAIGLTGMHNIQLTLLGNCAEEIRAYFHSIAKANGLKSHQVQFVPVLEEKHISTLAAEHHIGLACEIPHVINRDICLTNKIFLYLVAGNAIIFSKTKAQLHFYNNHPEIGSIFGHNNPKELSALLLQYIQEPEILNKQRLCALTLGKMFFNWENEKKQLLQLISVI
jgi:glycosyltransferase involved in cell wall biosynthesis